MREGGPAKLPRACGRDPHLIAVATLAAPLAAPAEAAARSYVTVTDSRDVLPFTGFEVWMAAALGSALLAAGILLRRALRAT